MCLCVCVVIYTLWNENSNIKLLKIRASFRLRNHTLVLTTVMTLINMQVLNHYGTLVIQVQAIVHLNNQICLMNFIGVFEGNRLIIVITKFDQQSGSADLSDTWVKITENDVKEQTCQFVRKICPTAKISHDDVLPVSGRWAYHARMLASTPRHHAMHSKYEENVKKCLCAGPNPTRGQEEDLYTSLDEYEDHELSKKLEEASGITMLEERYSKFMCNPPVLLLKCSLGNLELDGYEICSQESIHKWFVRQTLPEGKRQQYS